MILIGNIVRTLNVNNDRKLSVEMPDFKSAGGSDVIIECNIMCLPGEVQTYNIGDAVYVSFVQNSVDQSFVLGKVYKGIEDAKKSATGYQILNSLEVTDNATIPLNTKIGNTTEAEIISNVNNNTNDIVNLKRNINYSTNEQLVGSWIDGKNIYRKTYEVNISTIATSGSDWSTSFSISDLNYNKIWADMTHSIYIGDRYSLNEYTKSDGDYWNHYIDITESKVYIRGKAPDNGSKVYITLEYIKNS